MRKEEVKALCGDDQRLCWWAMVLFAEICDIAGEHSVHHNDDAFVASIVRGKVNQFPKIIIQHNLEKVKNKEKKDAPEDP